MDRDHGNGKDRRPRSSAARSEGPSTDYAPALLPVLPRLHIDGHYVAAESPHVAGGAWFDVIALADGRAVMLIGDAATGKSDAETTAMTAPMAGQLRRNLTAVLDTDDLAAVLDRVDRGLDGEKPVGASTVCVAIVDPQDGRVDFSTHGHPPPLLVSSGSSRYLTESTGDQSLETHPAAPAVVARLTPGEVLVLHSDGLAPQTRQAMAAGLYEAIRHTDGFAAPASERKDLTARTDSICRTTTAELRRAGACDSLAVLAVEQRPEISRLVLTVPAVHRSLEAVDRTVNDWLSGLRSSVEDGVGVALAVGEAVTNAIQHAFVGQRVGLVRVQAELQNDGVLAFSVKDDGRWLPPESSRAGRAGRGLRMIGRLCDRMVVHRDTNGTVIELRRRLHHPVIRASIR